MHITRRQLRQIIQEQLSSDDVSVDDIRAGIQNVSDSVTDALGSALDSGLDALSMAKKKKEELEARAAESEREEDIAQARHALDVYRKMARSRLEQIRMTVDSHHDQIQDLKGKISELKREALEICAAHSDLNLADCSNVASGSIEQ
jgi:beta-glucosidase-like glycosyl hydrolase